MQQYMLKQESACYLKRSFSFTIHNLINYFDFMHFIEPAFKLINCSSSFIIDIHFCEYLMNYYLQS